jgi:hypothetical protein
MLNGLAKNMGVLVSDTQFATFDMLKELEIARNCLHSKQNNKFKLNTCVEIAEFVPDEKQVICIDSSEEDFDLEEMLIQQSKEKSKFGKKEKNSFSLGGRKQDQEDPDLLDSRNLNIPMNLNKRKNQRKK